MKISKQQMINQLRPGPDYITTEEAAELLDISTDQVGSVRARKNDPLPGTTLAHNGIGGHKGGHLAWHPKFMVEEWARRNEKSLAGLRATNKKAASLEEARDRAAKEETPRPGHPGDLCDQIESLRIELDSTGGRLGARLGRIERLLEAVIEHQKKGL